MPGQGLQQSLSDIPIDKPYMSHNRTLLQLQRELRFAIVCKQFAVNAVSNSFDLFLKAHHNAEDHLKAEIFAWSGRLLPNTGS
jgi:hypothetical protein